jgi:cyclopropane-fatty-acyl-phospholipid synthase
VSREKHSPLQIPPHSFGGAEAERWRHSPEAPPGIGRWLLGKLLDRIGNPPIQFVLWNGERVPDAIADPAGLLHLRDPRTLWQLVLNPELVFGDAYSRGSLEVEGDLVEVLEAIYRAAPVGARGDSLVERFYRYLNRAGSNSLRHSRANIEHHYNIGNPFFRLWLDQEMVYTCAYFPAPDLSLEQAQLAKMDHVCRKLRLSPGETVVEAGCGWGALARHMASRYGVKVRAYNLSREQIDYARERARAEGLAGAVEFIEDDYRNIQGRYDAFVSVGMLEHVGHDNYPVLGEVIDRSLATGGRGLIHSIGRDSALPMNAWIERRIFPGSYPPTLREIMDVFEPNGFSVLDVENLRLHYAETLRHWLTRFDKAEDAVCALADDAFVRSWRLYLAGSLAGFSTGTLQLFQVVFTRSGDNAIPWTRAHQYDNGG